MLTYVALSAFLASNILFILTGVFLAAGRLEMCAVPLVAAGSLRIVGKVALLVETSDVEQMQ